MSTTLSGDWVGWEECMCMWKGGGLRQMGVKTEGPWRGDQWEQKGPGEAVYHLQEAILEGPQESNKRRDEEVK